MGGRFMAKGDKIGILFVCTGNICRSPTAEGVCRAMAARTGLQDKVIVDSAGTQDYHIGDAPDSRAVAEAALHGVDIAMLRARQVTADDFRTFDYIVAMDRTHMTALKRMQPVHEGQVDEGQVDGGRAQLALLLSFCASGLKDVPDPYYGQRQAFTDAYDLIQKGVAGLLAQISKNF
jgi:protein-tyrosine phosphatase